MLYRMKSGCDKSSYTGTKNYFGVIGALYLAYKFGQTRPVDEENSERDQHLEGKVICLGDWVY